MQKHYNHLTRDERCQIQAFKSIGMSSRAIAVRLKVDRTTISRELKRNQGKKGYRFQQADTLAAQRRRVASSRPTTMTPNNLKIIEEKLREGWSPDQISGRLKLSNIYLSHESIYQYVWADKKLGGKLYTHLRHSGKKYNRRSSGKAGRGCIPNRVDIKERPLIVEKKSRIGDWEGDTIIGAKHKGAILTLVERKSKYTIMEKLKAKTAEEVVIAIERRFSELPYKVCTMTFDNGKEFSEHERIAKNLNIKCYFATPYHSWERGLNEHTNGLIRQDIPKSSNLLMVPKAKIMHVEKKINDRPRKVLKYRTPKEVLFKSLGWASDALQY
jgi:IS30 family transposase